MPGLRLSTRITIAAVALVVAGAIALMFIEEARLRNVYLNEQRAGLEKSLHAEKLQLSHAVGNLRQDVLFLSNTPPVSGIVRAALNRGYDVRDGNTREKWEARLQQIFSAFLAAHPDYFQVRFIGVADGARELVRVDNRAGKIEIMPRSGLQAKGDRDYFKATLGLRAGEVSLSEFSLNQEWGVIEQPYRPSLRASTPVYMPSGQIFGMVVVNMDAGSLLASAASTLPAGVQVYIANMGGGYLLHPDARRSFGFELGSKDNIVTDFPFLKTMFKPQASEYLPLQTIATKAGTQYLAAERIHFDSANPARFMTLAYYIPDGLAARDLLRIPATHIIGGFIAMLLVSGIAMLVLRRVFAPLEQISAAADKIAAGDHEAPLPQNGSGEIGSLTNALSVMLTKLSQREQEVRRANAGLEERVKERTIELERAQQNTERLLRELGEQKIELEMQNDELRRAQVALEESRDRYADLYDFAPIGYLTLTREALISEINLTGAALLGAERGKLIGSRFARLVSPGDSDRWHLHFMDMLQHGGQRSFELALRRGDGSSFHAQLDCLRPINDGNAPAVRIVLTDITERKQAESLLRRNQVLMQNSMDGVHVLDGRGNLLEANDAFCRMLGYTQEEVAHFNVADWNAQFTGEELRAQFKDIIGKSALVETVHRRKDGVLINVEISATGIEIDSRTFVFASARDVTGRKQAEALLRQHKTVIDTSIDGFWITDMAGNLLEANQAYAKISGYTVEELVNMRISQLEAVEQSPEEVHAHIAKVVAQGYGRFETRHRHKDGHEIDIEVSVTYAAESQQLFAFCRDITGRMKTEEDLRVAAEAFETQDAIMITDADGNIIRVNRAFSAITGYSPEEVLGKKQDVMNQGQHDDISCIGMLQQSIRDDLWTGEIWDKRKNGQVYPKWMTVTAVKNERHETTHYVIIFSDITARKQIEKENLRESDLRFRGTLEQAAVGIAHATLDGHFRQINQKFCNIVGYARDELINMSYQDITFSADLDENFYFMQQLLAGKISTFSIEKRYVRKNQSLVWVNLTVSLLRDVGGASKYTIGVIEDISERKQAEVLVQQFGHLLQSSFNEIYLFDANSLYFLLTSEGAEKNLGYSGDELNQLTPLDLKPSLTRESFEQMLAPLRSGKQQLLFFESIHRRKDGTTYPVEVRLQFMQSESPVFLSIVQDITARKQAEMEINQSRQLLRDLVAQSEAFREEERKCLAREVHDELGQTLTALRMNVSLLRIEFGGNNAAMLERMEQITGLLDQSIQCTRDVVNNLRPVALDMGIIPAIRWLCDEFIKHTGAHCVVYAPEEEIHLDEPAAVAAFRIAQESLTNAARYAEASKVEIIIKQDTDNFSVTVNDNGKGFDYMAIPNHQSFGLLGMRERAIALGGVVNIYSTPQQGTQVSLTVPNTRILTDTEGGRP